ncbi:EAL domain protein [Vibrio coralliirubri]|uniref:EAL domain-containing protein n=1 Tax=Vibrio coralliirubri TaxID=1516159 RepID=UPI0006390DB9|nr:EAL domain-containing protein [Vibrio coralliirubri]CDT91089.1 EAL domain protein [Vibrio coralliirubri]
MIIFNKEKKVFEIFLSGFNVSSVFQELRDENGNIYGYEALCRIDKDGQHIPTLDFFKYLKEIGEPKSIGVKLLILSMHLKGFRYSEIYSTNTKLFVNITPTFCKSLYQHQGLLEYLLYSIYLDDLKSEQLVLEITETSCPIDSVESFYRGVNYLKSIGLLIAIDDFGTGCSDFSRVAAVKPNYIKVSRELMLYSQVFKTIDIQKLNALSRLDDIILVYEGIESLSQYEFAKTHGAALYQGYLLSKPKQYSVDLYV